MGNTELKYNWDKKSAFSLADSLGIKYEKVGLFSWRFYKNDGGFNMNFVSSSWKVIVNTLLGFQAGVFFNQRNS